MKTVGIICEYNPLHNGHVYQMNYIREKYGDESRIVCIMSGNYVQRGAPAIIDKSVRAQAAIMAGADLVVELPIGVCLSSAEGFAFGGVEIAQRLCDVLSFGTESMSAESLMMTAAALNSERFSAALKDALKTGISFPAARQQALEQISHGVAPVLPNDILGTEYCRAILAGGNLLEIAPIPRQGSYHSESVQPDFPSATAVRTAMLSEQDWMAAVPACIREIYSLASLHDISAAERAILYRLRTMREEDFEALPYGSEGLWRRFMHACRTEQDLNGVIAQTKTKRYTRSRIDRMILCAFLGISEEIRLRTPPYLRILAFNSKGRLLIKEKSDALQLVNAGEKMDSAYQELENRCGDLYGLFSMSIEGPGAEANRRIFYDREVISG